jgi:predicted Zn finger-like uncharacterized protein
MSIMKQIRCPKCNKTLFRVYDNDPYSIEVKCPRCKAIIYATDKECRKEHQDEDRADR